MHDLVRRLVEGASGQGVSEEAMINEVGDLTKYIRDKLSAANEAEKEPEQMSSIFERSDDARVARPILHLRVTSN